MVMVFAKDSLRASVEAATGGKVTVLYDDLGYPSYMTVIPKFNVEDIDESLGSGVHPAFLVGGVEKSEIFIGQYPAIVKDGRALSLPGVDPASGMTFDAAREYCTAKGQGWHMMTNWEWAAVALWCKANGFEPRGNSNAGRHHTLSYETGRRQDGLAPGNVSGTARTLAGSGPSSWRHDNTLAGISDMVGNIWKWIDGMKLVNGAFYMPNDNDYAADEADWAAHGVIIADDSGTTKLGTPSDTLESTGDTNLGTWRSLATTTSYDALSTAVKQRMQQAMIDPLFADDPQGAFNFNTDGETVPLRGGDWNSSSSAGLGALSLNYARANTGSHIGLIPAYIS